MTIQYAQIAPLIEKLQKASRSYSGYGRVKRQQAQPAPAGGKFFTVHAIFSETFE